jgi:hypothetical protein
VSRSTWLFLTLFGFFCSLFHRAFEQHGDHGARNLTVEASFGAEREISLQKTTAEDNDEWTTSTIVHVPQTNNGIFSIGRDVNIRFQNSAIEQADEDPEHKNSRDSVCGRISITIWGHAENAVDELGSPPRLQNPSGVKVSNR